MIEEWRTHPRFTNYQASTLGRVRRIRNRYGSVDYAIIKGSRHCAGYTQMKLVADDGSYVDVLRHHLVAEAFLGPRPTKHDVAHNDGTRTNDAPSNLRYATRADNLSDTILHGTRLYGERAVSAKFSNDDVAAIRLRYANGLISQERLALELGTTQSAVSLMLRGLTYPLAGGPLARTRVPGARRHRRCPAPSASLGSVLAAMRRERGYSQRQVAARLGLTPRTVGNIERGCGARAATLEALARALGTELSAVRVRAAREERVGKEQVA